MKPIPIRQQRVEHTRSLMDLDDAEMALELLDLNEARTIAESRRPPSKPIFGYDALLEVGSAACLVLDKEEREALAHELEQIFSDQHHPVAA